MAVAIVLLVLTNLLTLAVLAVLWWRGRLEPVSDADPVVATALAGARPRQVISIEVLNPVDVAAKRNRLVGFAGAFVPRITQRLVSDQLLRVVRQQLADEQVAADVRLHRIAATTAAPSQEAAELEGEAVIVVDEVAPLRLEDRPER